MTDLNSQIEQLAIDRNDDRPKSSNSRYFLGFVVLLSVITIAVVQNNNSNESLANNVIEQVPVEKIHEPESKIIQPSVLDASGHIVARRIATVSSRITGKIVQLNIEEGQKVKRNDVLAMLDDKQAKITYQLAVANLAAIKAIYEELEILYHHEKQLSSRRQKLAKNHLISDEVAESSEVKAQQMAAQLKNKSALIAQSKQRLELAQYQLDQHNILAPFDGVVISKNAQVGELISAGSSGGGFIRTGVATIVDMSSLEIEVEVGESYINRVFPGQKVESRLDAYPKWKIKSEVVAIIPTADRQKATIKVRVKLLEANPRILPDMGIKVSFLSLPETK